MNDDARQAQDLVFTVDETLAGARLDVYLTACVSALSRSQIKYAIEEGHVTVNGKRAKAGHPLKTGDVVTLHLEPAAEAVAVPQNIPLVVVYEDAAIIVVDKPAGIVVHPAPGNPDRTLVNALLFHCRDLSGIGGVLRPGIVHRLDKETSGLLVAAKTDEAHRHLSRQFEHHEVHKNYMALVWGDVKGNDGEIALPVGRHPVDRKKMSTKSRHGKESLTLWKVRERFGPATLLDVEIHTGRTHQIRVHLSERGYPVVGDSVYGRPPGLQALKNPELRNALKTFERHALHAAKLSFVHPQTANRLVFSSSLPSDMEHLCALFRGKANPGLQNWKDQLK